MPPDEPARLPAEGKVVDPVVLAERRAQRAELAEQVAARRAADAQALAAELSGERARLEAELEEARREPERLSRLVAERERALRAAEQRAHGEEAQRIETAEQLADAVRRHETELAELRARSERAETLAAERAEELRALRTRLTEAEQIAAEAESARRRAELKRQSARDKRRRAVETAHELEHELELARAEAQAAREGADAVIAEAAHEQRERDRLRAELEQADAERAALRAELERLRAERAAEREQAAVALEEARTAGEAEREQARVALEEARAAGEAEREQAAVALEEARAVRERSTAPPAAHGSWKSRFAAELACARAMRPAPAAAHAVPWPLDPAAPHGERAAEGRALALERRLLATRRSGLPGTVASGGATGARSIEQRTAGTAEGGRAAAPAARAIPVTALALERERSTRLQAQLERQAETERELREQVAELERAVASRMDAEQRIERALQRVRGELEAANALRMLTERGSSTRPLTSAEAPGAAAGSAAAASAEPARPVAPDPVDVDEPALAGFDAARLAAARERLRAATPPEPETDAPDPAPAAEAASDAPAADTPALHAADAPVSDEADAPAADAAGTADAAGAADAAGTADAADAPAAGAADAAGTADAADAPAADAADAAGTADASMLAPGVDAPATTAPAPPAAEPAAAPPVGRTPASALTLVPAPAEVSLGPPAPWLPAALRRLLASDPETAGRIVVGMLPAQGLVTQRDLSYDLVIADRGTVAVDVRDGRTSVRALEGPRQGQPLDFKVTATHARLARLLLGRRGLRRRAKVRGSRRRLKELRRLAQEPLALRDLAASGATLEPALALWLAALAIDPADTFGHRFTIAHAPLPGGPADAWLRIQQGMAPVVLRTRPGEQPAVTLRCTRGALLALLAGITPPPGEGAAVDGDLTALERVRGWIRATEFPAPPQPRGRRGGRG